MISIKQINERDIDLCYELDLNTISLWSKKQWANEFKKEGTKIFGLLFENFVIGICVFNVVLDEAQINYFVVKQKFRKKGFGSYLMSYLINRCEKLNLKKLLLEVSQSNLTAERFYSRFDFSTVGIRKNYYKDGSNALLKEKNLQQNNVKI
jgi:ribosomal-protein-alanine N-acetyltransferase